MKSFIAILVLAAACSSKPTATRPNAACTFGQLADPASTCHSIVTDEVTPDTAYVRSQGKIWFCTAPRTSKTTCEQIGAVVTPPLEAPATPTPAPAPAPAPTKASK